MIIVKVLYEKRELDTLPGRITLGILVLQDIFAILFLAVQPSLADLQISVLLLSIARVAALVATALVLSRYVLPWLFHRIARTPELVLLGALAWCFLIGEIAERLHLSREMGSLVAGVSLSTFPYALDVTAKVTTLRDFFITLFFVGLGMTIPIPNGSVIALALAIAAFTVVSRVVTTFVPLYLMRQGLRASLLPALNLAQISEFSLVVIQTGIAGRPHRTADRERGVVRLRAAGGAVDLRDGAQRPDHPPRDRPLEADRPARSRSRPSAPSRHEAGHGAARRIVILGFFRAASALLSEIERQQPGAAQADQRDRLQPERVPHAGRARHARDLWRHQQCRHAAACRRRQGRDHHPQRAGFAAEGRQQREAGAPRPRAQPDRQDRRHRRPAGRRRAISTRPAPTTSP